MAEDVMSLVSASQNVAISDESSQNGAKPARARFPLPRELRDQIYGYLLRHEHVHEGLYSKRPPHRKGKFSEIYSRGNSAAITYRFHTSILATNRTIHSEALEILESNNFVVVSHRWPGASTMKHDGNLAVVTEHQAHVARFQHHVLRVHFEAPPSTECAPVKPESWVLVADRLPAFCRCLQFDSISISTPAEVVAYTEGQSARSVFSPGYESSDVARVKIQFKDSDFTKRKPEVAKSMLDPFAMVVIGKQRVTISNFADSLMTHVASLKQTMAPRCVWVTALAWHVLEILRYRKAIADKLLRLGYHKQASKMYTDIWLVRMHCHIYLLDTNEYTGDVVRPISAMNALLLQAAVTSAFLCLKLDFGENRIEFLKSTRMVQELLDATARFPEPVQKLTMAMCATNGTGMISAWFITLSKFLFWRADQSLTESTAKMLELEEILSRSAPRGHDSWAKHFKHDLELITTTASDEKARAEYLTPGGETIKNLIKKTSAVQLSVPFSSTPLPPSCTKPAHIKGLVDLKGLEQTRAIDPKLAASLE